MSGKDKQEAQDAKAELSTVLDDEYQGKEVVCIPFDKEKSSVPLDDNFVIIESMEKREKTVKITAAIFSVVCLVSIVCASIFLVVSDGNRKRDTQATGVQGTHKPMESTPTATIVVTPKPTKKPTPRPTKKPTPKPTKKPTPRPTARPVITKQPVTAAPKPTKAPRQVTPKQTKKPDDVFVEDGKKSDDVFVY
ncbi:MAG: hypothetical protein IIY81_13635 [Lachnospiraceae bacterium]|jgi:type IV secretory pathway VirB10-like protein|nr:hypothetical protein [Lachnospiraceae bacterium]